MNEDMLAVARTAAPTVAERLGYGNVSFVKGRIEDLALDREALDQRLAERPVSDEADLAALERYMASEREEHPLVADDSIDVVVSNCVLNLVLPERKPQLFEEVFRVLRKGGRAIISDIVSDETVPERLRNDSELWSGCISGAFREDDFLAAFEAAGFHGVEILERGEQPWRTVEGIEFRSDHRLRPPRASRAPVSSRTTPSSTRAPGSRVQDDDGHTFHRGHGAWPCAARRYRADDARARTPSSMIGVASARRRSPRSQAAPFACTGTRVRDHPRETKGEDYTADITPEEPGDCCEPGDVLLKRRHGSVRARRSPRAPPVRR